MARRGLGAEQIVSKLRQIEVLMAQGKLPQLACGSAVLSQSSPSTPRRSSRAHPLARPLPGRHGPFPAFVSSRHLAWTSRLPNPRRLRRQHFTSGITIGH